MLRCRWPSQSSILQYLQENHVVAVKTSLAILVQTAAQTHARIAVAILAQIVVQTHVRIAVAILAQTAVIAAAVAVILHARVVYRNHLLITEVMVETEATDIRQIVTIVLSLLMTDAVSITRAQIHMSRVQSTALFSSPLESR